MAPPLAFARHGQWTLGGRQAATNNNGSSCGGYAVSLFRRAALPRRRFVHKWQHARSPGRALLARPRAQQKQQDSDQLEVPVSQDLEQDQRQEEPLQADTARQEVGSEPSADELPPAAEAQQQAERPQQQHQQHQHHSHLQQPIVQLPVDEVTSWAWQGEDDFSPLGDRQDLPPLPLPPLPGPRRVVLVRHGQSTWNARNRIQGSSNFSVLTDQGYKQAKATGKLLRDLDFDVLFHSPLVRAAQTAEAVWRGRPAPRHVLPQLREIDLYSFQGLEKVEAKFDRGELYKMWQFHPAGFEIDGHAPVRELWYRASLAWREMLGCEDLAQQGLVVAHNAVNQALVCTALGLPPTGFRRFTQTNAGFTVLDFEPGVDGAPRARVERLNQLPLTSLLPEKVARQIYHRLVLVAGPASSSGIKPALDLLAAHNIKTAPLMAIGSPQDQAVDIRTALEASLATPGRVRAVVAVADPPAIQTLLGWALEAVAEGASFAAPATAGASPDGAAGVAGAGVGEAFQIDEGSITILNYVSDGQPTITRGVVLCTNFSPGKPAAAGAAAEAATQEGEAAAAAAREAAEAAADAAPAGAEAAPLAEAAS